MKIYLAGPMSGYSRFNFPAFHEAADSLRAAGHFVFSPAEEDIRHYGVDISLGNETGSIKQAASEHGFDRREALARDLAWICKKADAIALLPGWEKSKGAKAEKVTAEALDLEIIYL